MSAIEELRRAYRSRALDPASDLAQRQAALLAHAGTVITPVPLATYLHDLDLDLPLAGVPFVIKDNIDLAGVPTTAGCPGYAYTPRRSALAVQFLLDAGAVPLAKVNLDQFATGLVGTRSPYGTPLNPLAPDRIPGGSSSGSAVAVALGAALFGLGTDTAGSGRVPAAACNIVGLKPTRGRISCRGVVPACRSLDCVSVFAGSCQDAATVLQVLSRFDPEDALARRLPVAERLPATAIGFLAGADLQIDDPVYGAAYQRCLEFLQVEAHELQQVDYAPFAAAAKLLYGGPWVAERTAAVGEAVRRGLKGLDETVAGIIRGGEGASAIEAFQASYTLAAGRRAAEAVWEQVGVLLLPSIPGLPSLAAVAADPLGPNSRLGTYTNWVNLLDCCALTLPMHAEGGVASITLVAPAWHEDALLALGSSLLARGAPFLGRCLPAAGVAPLPAIDPPKSLALAVCGAHLQGEPLHYQLLQLGARLRQRARTAAAYRLYELPDARPLKPGLLRVASGGVAIAIEIYELPTAAWGTFISQVPAPLTIGKLELEDGSHVHGFLCESSATAGARDLSEYGGWREYQRAQALSQKNQK